MSQYPKLELYIGGEWRSRSGQPVINPADESEVGTVPHATRSDQYMKPCIMELDGHAPVIVCDDVDPVKTAATSVVDKTRNAGQVCVSPHTLVRR
ncbi:MAG: aldehyde dehydrogenase family protein [Hyphomicrobiaceae bacterium]